jgi:hypothetical protein
MSNLATQDGVMKNELPAAVPATPSVRFVRSRACTSLRTSQMDFALPMSKGPIPKGPNRPPSIPPAGSRARAQWWFTQMRQIVAEGRDFDAAGVF